MVISLCQQLIFISRYIATSVFFSINVFSLSMGNLKSRMTVFYSRTMISISHAVISQSHISITETREVILDSTHFCPVWLAI